MKLKKFLVIAMAAAILMTDPIQADAASLSVGLEGGISSTMDFAVIEEDEMEEVLDSVVRELYTGICVAHCNDYVNIRSEASEEGEILGKLYNKCVGQVEAREGDWYEITSGSVHGFVKGDYIEIGDAASEIAEKAGTRMAYVNTETLRVRTEATLDSSVLGLIPGGESLVVTDETEDFAKVSIEEGDGWVSKEFVLVETVYTYAESKEEEAARLKKEEEARRAANAAAARSTKGTKTPLGDNPGTSAGNAVVNYATQFVGNPYVWGGTSLTNGADCSGFVMSVYRHFGVSLPHSSSALRSVGYGVSFADARPGDLICYSGHVAIYMGGGRIVHASNRRDGIKISGPANYRPILAVRRIF